MRGSPILLTRRTLPRGSVPKWPSFDVADPGLEFWVYLTAADDVPMTIQFAHGSFYQVTIGNEDHTCSSDPEEA